MDGHYPNRYDYFDSAGSREKVNGYYPNRYDFFDSAGSREKKRLVTTQKSDGLDKCFLYERQDCVI